MTHHSHYRLIFFGITFALALIALGYFAGQSGQSDSPSPANFLAADKGYGLTIDLTQYDDETLAHTLADLRQNGLLWLRQPFLWSQIEPAPGQFNWDPLDRILAAVERNNVAAAGQPFKLIAVLHTSPRWARPLHTPATTPPTQAGDFGRFARAFARRYAQQIDYYQIWHEPNLSANWGQAHVDAPAYAHLLREAALNIRQADASALILSAALAPTLENGPLNLNELDYLDRLYQAKANRWFDIVAGQPYGFDFDPSAPPTPNTLNFRRLELMRHVMLNNGDADTPIWATAFGWNALPANWSGRPSPWRDDQTRTDPPEAQAQRTAAGLAFARQNWPWLGPALAIRWDSAGLSKDDPAAGFALSETPLLGAFRSAAAGPIAAAGRYPANHPSGRYSPGWRTALTLADIPRHEPRTLTITFAGTRLDLMLNRGPYRGYLWVTVDDQPANALPQNSQGRSYVVLYDPLRQSASVTLAQNLAPGPHQAVIEAEGGWGQWAIAGWIVSNSPSNQTAQAGLLLAGAIAGLSGLELGRQVWPQLTGATRRVVPLLYRRKLSAGRFALPGETAQVVATFTLAIAFYLAPDGLAMGLLLPLAIAILCRPDLGLALIAFSLSFFQAPKQLPIGPFLLTETTLLLTAAGFGLKGLAHRQFLISNRQSLIANAKSSDWAALALLVSGYISTLAAPNFGVSMFEWRMVVLGPVVYYFLVRLGRDYGPPAAGNKPTPPRRWAWRLIDVFVAGGVLHAAIALYGYFWGDQFVAAEGARRALSPVYASPNNLSLFLGRVWPILLAVILSPRPETPQTNLRRGLYGCGLVIVGAALYLTFSKGALLVGLPAALIVMALFYLWRFRRGQWRRMVVIMAGSLGVIILALIPLGQTERFRSLFSFSQGSTGFFRLKLWQASLNMLSDYWPLGVGLDNFLYQYRTRYILPEAWQEPNLSHPHNIILDYGVRLGFGGVIILLWQQGAFWMAAWRLYQKLPEPLVLGLAGSMAVFLSHGFIDNAYFLVDLAYIFFLSAGIAQRLAECEASL